MCFSLEYGNYRDLVSGDNMTKPCSIFDMMCYLDAATKFANEEKDQHCDCKDDCTSIEYDVISQPGASAGVR